MAGNEPREDAKLDLQATHLEEGFMVVCTVMSKRRSPRSPDGWISTARPSAAA